jgi:ribosome-associated protein
LLIDLSKINSYLDYFVIARRIRSFTAGLWQGRCRTFSGRKVFPNGEWRISIQWIALDYHEIVVHIFTREMREYLQLERLWADAESIEFR